MKVKQKIKKTRASAIRKITSKSNQNGGGNFSLFHAFGNVQVKIRRNPLILVI